MRGLCESASNHPGPGFSPFGLAFLALALARGLGRFVTFFAAFIVDFFAAFFAGFFAARVFAMMGPRRNVTSAEGTPPPPSPLRSGEGRSSLHVGRVAVNAPSWRPPPLVLRCLPLRA